MPRRYELRPTSTYPAIVGQVLARHRAEMGLNQAELAAHLRINQSAWSKIERGLTPPTVEQLALVASVFETTPGWLLYEADLVVASARERGLQITPTRIEPANALNSGWLLVGALALGGLVAAALAGRDRSGPVSPAGYDEDDEDDEDDEEADYDDYE